MWPFKNIHQKESILQNLVFKDGSAFFEYQCKYGETDIKQNKGVVAIVVDAPKEFGTKTVITVNPDGSQLAIVRVAAEDGGFIVPTNTPSKAGDKLVAGDLVIWVPMVLNKELGSRMGDPRSGWIGMIRAKIEPEIDLTKSGFNIICGYD